MTGVVGAGGTLIKLAFFCVSWIDEHFLKIKTKSLFSILGGILEHG